MSLEKATVGKTLHDLFFSILRRSPALVQKVEQAGEPRSSIDLLSAVGDLRENEGASATVLEIAKKLGLNLEDFDTQIIDVDPTDVEPPKLSE